MRAGKLRHPAWLQSPTVSNSDGETTLTWTTQATRRVSVEPITSKEILQGEQPDTRTRIRVRLRYYSGLNTSWRVVLLDAAGAGERTLHIDGAIDVNGRGREWELLCTETPEPGGGSEP